MKRLERGFTLVELLIYTGILAVVLSVTLGLFFQSRTIETQVTENQEVDRNARIAFLEMTQTIRGATSVTTPVLGDSAASLALNSNAISYSVSGSGVLQKTDSSGTYNITGSGVTIQNLTFTTRGEVGKQPTVSISFTLRSNTIVHPQSTYISRAYQTTVQLR